MKNIVISKARDGNEVFPQIELNAETGICTISGNSYMQNPRIFFKPVLEWFREYTLSLKGDLFIIYNLENLNTGTSRVLFEIIKILKKYKNKGASIKIQWNYSDKQEMHVDDIIDITSNFGIDVEVVSK